MKADKKKNSNNEVKKKLSTLELAIKMNVDPKYKNLHLILEPHEISVLGNR